MANAILISAAPDLADACLWALQALDVIAERGFELDPREQLRAALKKAGLQ